MPSSISLISSYASVFLNCGINFITAIADESLRRLILIRVIMSIFPRSFCRSRNIDSGKVYVNREENTDMRLRRTLSTVYVALLLVLAAGMWSDSMAQGALTVEFSSLPNGTLMPWTYQIAGVTFFAHASLSTPNIYDQGTPSERGYRFPDTGVTVTLPMEVRGVEVRICLPFNVVTIEALDTMNKLVAQKQVPFGNKCGDVSLEGDRISVVRFTGGSNEASIVRLSAALAQ